MSKQLAPNRLRPQLARRQLVTQTHPFGFDSRRLHHLAISAGRFDCIGSHPSSHPHNMRYLTGTETVTRLEARWTRTMG